MIPLRVAQAMAVLGPERSRDIQVIVEAIAPVLHEHVIKLLDSKCAKLQERVAELEQRRGMRFRGVWNQHDQYDEGDFATDHGAGWVAKCLTRQRPDYGCSDWQLAVKRGRDGRDAPR